MCVAIAFLSGVGTDHAGRTVDQIASWSHAKLEETHDYIQWVFPTMAPSQFNPHAPVLTEAEVVEGAGDERVVRNLRRMAVVMAKFYGLERTCSAGGPYYDLIEDRQPWWMRAGNHNFLRITRILSSLRLFGLTEEAEALLDVLEALAPKFLGPADARVPLEFWRDACHPGGANAG